MACIDFDEENKDKDPKFQIADLLRMPKHKSNFVKGYAPNGSG